MIFFELSEEKQYEILEKGAWEPFEGYSGDLIDGYIKALADGLKRIAEEALSNKVSQARNGYILVMRLLQSELSLDEEEKSAINYFINNKHGKAK